MRRIRVQRPKRSRERRWLEVLAVEPQDPDIVHAKALDPAVEAVGLEKSYGRVRVLDGVDLGVAPGSVFALLGPNGAGKTTIVRILATLIGADAGQARVAGVDVVRDRRQVRHHIGLRRTPEIRRAHAGQPGRG
jgi:ABC-type uncharacterized transport system ATPase subunit